MAFPLPIDIADLSYSIKEYFGNYDNIKVIINKINEYLIYVDSSLNIKPSKFYVDGSLSSRDVSINFLYNNVGPGPGAVTYSYVDGSLNVKTSFLYVDSSLNVKANISYIDSSLSLRDVSIAFLDASKAYKSYVDGSLNVKSNTTHNHNLNNLSEKSYNSLSDKPLNCAVPIYSTPANPTPITGASDTMLGLGNTLNITPLKSGNIKLSIRYFSAAVGTTSSSNIFRLRRGTGAVPVNGAAATGTVIGGTDGGGYAIAVGATAAPIVRNVIVMGSSIGVATWFDLSVTKASGLTSITASGIEVTLEELSY